MQRAALDEKVAQQLAAGVGQDSADELRAVVQARLAKQVEHRPRSARLGVGRTEYDTRQAGVQQRHGAHGAGLQRDVKLALRQPVVAQQGGGVAQGDYFSVGGGVVGGDGAVVAGGDDLRSVGAGAQDHGAHRHLARQPGVVGLVQSQAHAVRVA